MRKGGRKIYRTMQGKQIDMDLLRKKHELTPAVGNVRVNARGDELGPGGKIIRKREDIIKEYYASNPNAVVDQEAAPVVTEQPASETVEMQKQTESKPVTRAQLAEEPAEEEWVEDEDGNFIPKQ
jgi:hypothetical protein